MIDPLLEIGSRVTALPIVHGSGDFAWEVRRLMMQHHFDCLAVPLPPSFQQAVETAVVSLPAPTVIVQRDLPNYENLWQPGDSNENFDSDEHDDVDFYRGYEPERDSDGYEPDDPFDDESEEEIEFLDSDEPGASFVPIDPCQPVIAAIRTAMGDHIPRKFVDLETSRFRPHSRLLPDAYALKRLPIQRFAAAVLPHIQRPGDAQWEHRIRHMAWQLKQLSVDYRNILFVTSILDWPWIRQAFHDRDLKPVENEPIHDVETCQVNSDSLYFMFGEIPFITGLYEKARMELDEDENLSIDGVKELLIASRETYRADYKSRARKITPKLLSQCLKYIRNLTLIDHRFTPQLATMVTAAQQVAGDGYALHVLEQSKQYAFARDLGLPEARMSMNKIAMPDGAVLSAANRLPGPPVVWTRLELVPKPDTVQQEKWKQRWNPFSQCSWPPEDDLIENFRQAVFDRAKEVMGADLAQTEKFTTSIKDGIDIRETIRHWYDGEIRVKVMPPNQAKLDVAVMLFDSPADPRDYPWRATWFAEHENESTLAFFGTDFREQPVGPGICLASYGGAMFIFPPVAIPDIWQDPRLDFTTTLEERLLAAACLHSRSPHIALLSPAPPGVGWKQLARFYRKTWVHLPLSRFSDSTVQQLRMVHVLNGKEVRSYAANFIRKV